MFPREMLQLCTKIAVFSLFPDPLFFFLYPKISTVTNMKKMRLNVCVDEIAPFGPFAAIIKGKNTL